MSTVPASQALADFIDAHRAEAVELLSRRFALFARGADVSLVEPWLQDQIDFFRGDASHTCEWMAVLVDDVRSSGGRIGDVLTIIRSVRETLLGFVEERIPDMSEAQVYRAFLDSEDHVLRHVGEVYGEAERKRASSEQRCQQMLAASMGRAFAMLNGDGAVTLTNAHFADLVGVPIDRIVGGEFLALCDEPTAAELGRDLRLKRGTRTHKFEGALRSRQDTIPAVFRVSPAFDEDGLRDGVAVTITPEDSAHRRQGNGFLVRGAEELADALQIGLCVLNDAGRVLSANEAAGAFVAVGEEDSSPCFAHLKTRGDSGARCAACMDQHALEAGQVRRDTIQLLTRTGEIRWVEVACVGLPGEVGSRNRIAKLLRDVTPLKKLEEQLLRHEHTSLASQLAVTVAHQSRNHLGVILGLTEMMAKGMPADQMAQAVDRVLRNGLRCKEVLDNLLAFGRGTTDEFVSVDLNAVIREHLAQAYSRADGPCVTWQYGEDLRPVACAPDRIVLVLRHLLDNALRMAEDSVCVSTSGDGHQVWIRVRDDGPGVAPEARGRLFEPFFSTHADAGGTGLGLSLSRTVVEEHHGRLFLDDAVDKGACFVVELPAEGAIGEPEPAVETPQAPEASERRLLIVEDEPDQLFLLTLALQARGHLVAAATTGAEAMTRLAGADYDAVVLDIFLGDGLGGRELHGILVRDDPGLAERTLFITGDTMKYETRRFLNEVGNPFLEKPFTIADFTREIERLLDKAPPAS